MNPNHATLGKLILAGIFAAMFVCGVSGVATAQTILATVSIPASSAGQVGFNSALDNIYAGGGPTPGSSLTVINGVTFKVSATILASAGVSVDAKNDNFVVGTLSSGNINVFAGATNAEIASVAVGSCPAAVTFDCSRRRMWVASQCGTGNDPVWVLNLNTLELIGSPIIPGGTITVPPVVSPSNGELYVTAGGVSKQINPTTFAVSNTNFGTVEAIDSNKAWVFATSGNNLQFIAPHSDTVTKTVSLAYTPAGMGVNNAMSHVYLLNSAAGAIDVYGETGKKITTFPLPSGDQPSSIAVDSVRGRLFVDVFNSGTSAWSLLVIEDVSTARLCGYGGSCDY
jgi:DNA-binding beta-propeller fold protein YncE